MLSNQHDPQPLSEPGISPNFSAGGSSSADPSHGDAILDVSRLSVSFPARDGSRIVPVEDVSFSVEQGERLAIVGESGSGKSLTALALMGLIPAIGGVVSADSGIRFRDTDITRAKESTLRVVRGGGIGMIFQDPLSALDPVHTVGRQIIETLELHRPDIDRAGRRDQAVELLRQVHLPRPERLVESYPHELSGGMRQRAMIAVALAGEPEILVADEPTTSLDVTVQAGVLDLLYELGESRGLSVILITHDLSLVAGFTERVMVMYGGRIAELASTDEIYDRPRHPYTSALLRSIPSLETPQDRLKAIPGSPPEPRQRPTGCVFHPRCDFADEACRTERPDLLRIGTAPSDPLVACHHAGGLTLSAAEIGERGATRASVKDTVTVRKPLVQISDLTKTFRVKTGTLRREDFVAVDNVSLEVYDGEALGIVGESGSGKSTLARCLLHLVEPTSGSVRFDGIDMSDLSPRRLRRLRMEMQMIFQDPASSMDPRMSVRRILMEPLKIHGRWGQPGHDEERLRKILELVQLPPDSLERYPHQFSGGQRQRVAIARALTLRPRLLVCDEPVSALDVSVRSSILNLLGELRAELDLTVVFIAHDLALVRFLCDRIGVMYQGELVELAEREELFENPRHAHTRELLNAQPVPDPTSERSRRDVRLGERAQRRRDAAAF